MSQFWPWGALILLGAYHGLNPAMGWLFALALGLQEKRWTGVLVALVPIAVGHAAAIAAALFVLRFIAQWISFSAVKWVVAGFLIALGIYRMFRAGHPRGAGMRVKTWELTVWSFLMASAHGAGLMVLPVLLAGPAHAMPHDMAMHSGMGTALPLASVLPAVLVHTAAMLVVAAALALTFFALYDTVGLKILRHAWLNFDLLWAGALVVAGLAVLLL
jgi:hypothetical protein